LLLMLSIDQALIDFILMMFFCFMKHVKECCFLFDEKSHSKDDCWFEPPGEMQQTNPWHHWCREHINVYCWCGSLMSRRNYSCISRC
jgi:hypothetical protein